MIKLFDMRKDFTSSDIPFPSADYLQFDAFGGYLFAANGQKAEIFSGKQWAQPQISMELKNDEKCF